jgi:hypothetical protein
MAVFDEIQIQSVFRRLLANKAMGGATPVDDEGRRRRYEEIPKSIKDLIDDPFRSLASELRLVGGFAKGTTPYSEFLRADFLRRRIKRKTVDSDFRRALEQARKFAKSEDANYLPGWCGRVMG